jgi:hypothetical protein
MTMDWVQRTVPIAQAAKSNALAARKGRSEVCRGRAREEVVSELLSTIDPERLAQSG